MVMVRERAITAFHPGKRVDLGVRRIREEGLAARQTSQYPEGEVSVVEVIPKALTNPTPVYVYQGWATEIRWRNIAAVVESGRVARGILLDTAQSYGSAPDDIKKAGLINRTLGDSPVDSVAYSAGCIPLVRAAIERPDLHRSMVLITPPIVPMPTPELMRRFIRQKKSADIQSGDKYVDPSFVGEAAAVISHVKRSISRVQKELFAISHANLFDLAAKAARKGVRIAVRAAIDDEIFTKPEIEQIADDWQSAGNAIPFCSFEWVEGTHAEDIVHPTRIYEALDSLQMMNA